MLEASTGALTTAETGLEEATRLIREQIKSRLSLRVFDVLTTSNGEIPNRTVASRASIDPRELGPAIAGIQLAARRAGVKPESFLSKTRHTKSGPVLRCRLTDGRVTEYAPSFRGLGKTHPELVEGILRHLGQHETATKSQIFLSLGRPEVRTAANVNASLALLLKQGAVRVVSPRQGRAPEVWALVKAKQEPETQKTKEAYFEKVETAVGRCLSDQPLTLWQITEASGLGDLDAKVAIARLTKRDLARRTRAGYVSKKPRVEPKANLTSLETTVARCLSDKPLSVEQLASVAGLSKTETRTAVAGLVERNLIELRAGAGYVRPGSAFAGGILTGDVFEDRFSVLVGDAEQRLGILPAESVDAIVTSPPYYKERDYDVAGQIGWEATPDEYVDRIVAVLHQCSRVLRRHGLVFLNFDDHVDGRQACIDAKIMLKLGKIGLEKFREIIWRKVNPMPNGTDNAPAHSYEKVFILKKAGAKHYWDTYAARQDAKHGGQKRLDDVWEIPVGGNEEEKGEHFASFPAELVERCLDVGASAKGYCAECGAPWRRVLERGQSTWKAVGATRSRSNEAGKRTGKACENNARDANGRDVHKKMADMQHMGWEPSCNHKGRPERGVVCDPFLGGGKTGIVSMRRGFEFFGVELNPSYAAKAVTRIREAAAGRPKRSKGK